MNENVPSASFDGSEKVDFISSGSFYDEYRKLHGLRTHASAFFSKDFTSSATARKKPLRLLYNLFSTGRSGDNKKVNLKQDKETLLEICDALTAMQGKPENLTSLCTDILPGRHVNDRVRTFVVIEIHEGQHIIKNWRCGDLVHYVNKIGSDYLKRKSPHKDVHHPYKAYSANRSIMRKVPPETDSLIPEGFSVESLAGEKKVIEVHHYYHCNGDYRKMGHSSKNRDTRNAGQLTYRDLRQIFTDGNPVASIEIILDKLIYGIQKLQKKHMEIERQKHSVCVTPIKLHTTDSDPEPTSSEIQGVVPTQVESWECSHTLERTDDQQEPDKILGNSLPRWSNLTPKAQMNETNEHKMNSIHVMDSYQGSQVFQNNRSAEDSSSFLLLMELEALELLFSGAFSQLTDDISRLEDRLQTIISKAAYQSPTKHAGQVLHALKNHTKLYSNRVLLYDKALDSLISKPDEMIQMELSKLNDEESWCNEACLPPWNTTGRLHQEPNPDLEILLEYFDQEIEQLRQRVSRVIEGIESVERLASLNLSLSRNQLLRWDVGSGMVAVVISLSALISGIFGMNVKVPMESNPYAFELITCAIALITLFGVVIISIIIRMTRL